MHQWINTSRGFLDLKVFSSSGGKGTPECWIQQVAHNKAARWLIWRVLREMGNKQSAVIEKKGAAVHVLHPAEEQFRQVFKVSPFKRDRTICSQVAKVSVLYTYNWNLQLIAQYALDFLLNERSILNLKQKILDTKWKRKYCQKQRRHVENHMNISAKGKKWRGKCLEKKKTQQIKY